MLNKTNPPIPSDRKWPFLGHLLALRAAGDIQPYVTDLHRRLGDNVRFRLGPRQWFVSTRNPEFLEQVSGEKFEQRPRLLRRQIGWLGDGNVAFMTGHESRRTRFKLRTMLTGDVLPRICDVGAALIEQEEPTWPDGAPMDIQTVLTNIALRIMGACCFSGDFGPNAAGTRVGEAFLEVLHESPLTFGALTQPVWRGSWWRWREKVRHLHLLVDALLFAHDTRKGANDLVAHLLSVKNDDGELFFDADAARMAVLAFFFGGVDATAVATVWTCALLARNPDAQTALYEELERVLRGRSPTYADLPKLSYLSACVDEALRIRPPNPFNLRVLPTKQSMGPYALRAGTIFLINSMAIHHNETLWPEPENYLPERFLDDKPRPHRYAFIPFGVGPKRCLGARFALTETCLVVAGIVQRRHLEFPADQTLDTTLKSGVLFPASTLKLALHKR